MARCKADSEENKRLNQKALHFPLANNELLHLQATVQEMNKFLVEHHRYYSH
jgi:hypothetical protein